MIYFMLLHSEEEKRNFVVLYRTHKQYMKLVAKQILCNEAEVEVVLYETFIKVAKKISKITAMNEIVQQTYLLILTRLTALEYKRRKH